MVWGFMSAGGVGPLHFVDGTVNADKYQKILEDKLLPTFLKMRREKKNFIFQQDGATCHTAKKNKVWMASQNIPILPWPPSSPDMSPIETLWGVMKKQLREYPAKTKRELRASLQRIWNGFTPEFCKKLVNSMPRQVSDLRRSKREVTKW